MPDLPPVAPPRISTHKQLALVTGGGSGIGEAIAHALAARGCRVVVCGRTESKLKTVADTAPAAPRRFSPTSATSPTAPPSRR